MLNILIKWKIRRFRRWLEREECEQCHENIICATCPFGADKCLARKIGEDLRVLERSIG